MRARAERERDGERGTLDKRDGGRWRVSGKERVFEKDLQDTHWRESDEEKDEQRETCRRPQRRIRLTNYLLLHYKGCQHGRLCQLSYTLMSVSVAHTDTHTHTTTYRKLQMHPPTETFVPASSLSQKCTHTNSTFC